MRRFDVPDHLPGVCRVVADMRQFPDCEPVCGLWHTAATIMDEGGWPFGDGEMAERIRAPDWASMPFGPRVEQVMGGGAATWHEEQPVPVTRHGVRQAA